MTLGDSLVVVISLLAFLTRYEQVESDGDTVLAENAGYEQSNRDSGFGFCVRIDGCCRLHRAIRAAGAAAGSGGAGEQAGSAAGHGLC